MSTIKVNKIENTSTTNGGVSIDNDGHVTVDGQQLPTAGPLSNRNLIINGAHVIQQRGNPSSGHNVFSVDRFRIYNDDSTSAFTVSQSSDSPDGFEKSSKVVVSSAITAGASAGVIVRYMVEGYDAAQLDLGTAAAKTFTLSFWVKSTLTGTFSGSFANGAFDRGQSYEYTINSANTWEYKTVTIAGDTTGSWEKTNSSGMRIYWDLGSGSNYAHATGSWIAGNVLRTSGSVSLCQTANAEFYLTGVQLEVGSKATPFEHRSYSDELQRCQRYYYRHPQDRYRPSIIDGNGGYACVIAHHPVTMRAIPTAGLITHSTFYFNPSGNGNSSMTPNGTGAISYSGDNVTGFACLTSNTNLGGAAVDQCVGQWWAQVEFIAEL